MGRDILLSLAITCNPQRCVGDTASGSAMFVFSVAKRGLRHQQPLRDAAPYRERTVQYITAESASFSAASSAVLSGSILQPPHELSYWNPFGTLLSKNKLLIACIGLIRREM